MVIQHNISSLNAWRNTKYNNNGVSKNLEKLSSGFRINRAADDAAGLAISEKMRGQIRGTMMGTQNVNMGINLIQTAEGGLNEVHAIMQRMRELAVQSSNGTYVDEVDREGLEQEYQSLMEEISRIAKSTHYNGIKLIDGSQAKNININDINALSEMQPFNAQIPGYIIGTFADAGIAGAGFMGPFNDPLPGSEKKIIQGYLQADAIASITFVWDTTTSRWNYTSNAVHGDGAIEQRSGSIIPPSTGYPIIIGDNVLQLGFYEGTLGIPPTDIKDGTMFIVDNIDLSGGAYYNTTYTATVYIPYDGPLNPPDPSDPSEPSDPSDPSDPSGPSNPTAPTKPAEGGLIIHYGANSNEELRIDINDMGSAALGIKNTSISTRELANDAIPYIDKAVNLISAERANLGAFQNRLESIARDNGVKAENLQAAESTIRDVDMAKEMMEFTKNNILVQAAQSMLAQANQLPQGVLSLLR